MEGGWRGVAIKHYARYLKMRALPLMIVSPLLGLVYIVLLPVIGAITIVPLMLWRAGQVVSQTVRGDSNRHPNTKDYWN